MVRRRIPIQLTLLSTLAYSSATLCFTPQRCAAEASAAERETARALMTEADRLRSTGDLRGAMARYQAAHAIMHIPTTGLDLARVQAQLGLLVEARGTASEVIHLPASAGEPRVFAEARSDATVLAASLEAEVPALKTEVEPATSYVVSIDGVTLPEATHALPFKLNPGNHTVRVDASGFEPQTRQVSVTEGTEQTLAIVLNPTPQVAPDELSPARVAAAAPHDSEDLHERAAAGRVRGALGLGIGGAAVVVGISTGLMSLVKTNDARSQCNHDQCQHSQRGPLASANALANVADVSIPLGLLGIAYGLYELLTLPDETQQREPQVKMRARGLTLGGAL